MIFDEKTGEFLKMSADDKYTEVKDESDTVEKKKDSKR
jgi:hypothetical protein